MEDWYKEGLVDSSSVSHVQGSWVCHWVDTVIRRRLGFAPFALALAILVHIKRQRLAPMEGWVGKGVTWLDADYDRSQKIKSESQAP